jgi:hypothetical protein
MKRGPKDEIREKSVPKKVGKRKNGIGTNEPEPVSGEVSTSTAAERLKAKDAARGSAEFEELLEQHFSEEQQKKIDEATENIFGSVLARHGWVRNEQGRVEYVGGEEGELSH